MFILWLQQLILAQYQTRLCSFFKLSSWNCTNTRIYFRRLKFECLLHEYLYYRSASAAPSLFLRIRPSHVAHVGSLFTNVQQRKSRLTTKRSYMPALFMTSQTQNARNKMATAMVVFSRLWNSAVVVVVVVDKLDHNSIENFCDALGSFSFSFLVRCITPFPSIAP